MRPDLLRGIETSWHLQYTQSSLGLMRPDLLRGIETRCRATSASCASVVWWDLICWEGLKLFNIRLEQIGSDLFVWWDLICWEGLKPWDFCLLLFSQHTSLMRPDLLRGIETHNSLICILCVSGLMRPDLLRGIETEQTPSCRSCSLVWWDLICWEGLKPWIGSTCDRWNKRLMRPDLLRGIETNDLLVVFPSAGRGGLMRPDLLRGI